MWEHYDRAYFSALGLTGEQALAAATARTASRATNAGTRRVDAQGRGQVQRMWSHVLSDNIAGFRRIAESRPVAIVSNNDGTAAKQCRDASICQVGPGPFVEVVALVDSGELGIAKPDPRIFTPAIDALDVDPARTLYVGDTVHADVRGATAAGLPVVQLDPYGLHAEDPHWTLPDVSALADHLEGLGVPPRS